MSGNAPPPPPDRLLAADELRDAVARLPEGWRLENHTLVRTYKTTGWKATLMLANALGHACEAAWHHPEMTLSYGAVKVTLWTHTAGGVSARDLALARRLEDLAMWRADESVLEGPPARHAIITG